eukprot:8754751-Pyramimonas_sp.AAC.1
MHYQQHDNNYEFQIDENYDDHATFFSSMTDFQHNITTCSELLSFPTTQRIPSTHQGHQLYTHPGPHS